MIVDLQSVNLGLNHKPLTFITHNREVLIICDERVIATLNICTMTKDTEDRREVPTKNFYLQFLIKDYLSTAVDKATAIVIVEDY